MKGETDFKHFLTFTILVIVKGYNISKKCFKDGNTDFIHSNNYHNIIGQRGPS